MKSPLRHRHLRELRGDLGKYLALFLFLVAVIGIESGFLVADDSMRVTYDESFEKYKIEDGHFILDHPANQVPLINFKGKQTKEKYIGDLLDEDGKVVAIPDGIPKEYMAAQLLADSDDEMVYAKRKGKSLAGILASEEEVTVQAQWYKEKESEGKTYRIYRDRERINKIQLIDGHLPEADDDIAVDRLFLLNTEFEMGDSLTIDDREFTICGTVAFSDYSALYKDNSQLVFDAQKFTVALVTDQAWEDLSDGGLEYCYAWRNENQGLTDLAQKEKADDILEVLKKQTILTDFLPQKENQAITFAGNDLGQDRSMFLAILYIVMVVLAFIFAITTKSTIERESQTVGTLLASGYTRGQLVRHYMALPVMVVLVAALCGNLLGYTVFKQSMADLYLNSYSLMPYHTVWSATALWQTTVIPCAIVILVSLFVLLRLLGLPALKFLRRDLSRKRERKAVKLPAFPFISRFRLRVIGSNKGAYGALFAGMVLASLLLMFGLLLHPLLTSFQDSIGQSKIADYQYVLKTKAKTKVKDAEKYNVASLKNEAGEEIMVYGIDEDSEYVPGIDWPKEEGQVLVTDSYMEKYGLKEGEGIRLESEYGDKDYRFRVQGTYYYPARLAVFMNRDNFNQIFDHKKGWFNGYFSNEKLTDIEEESIASIITEHDLRVVADQLNDSMGSFFGVFVAFCIILYLILIYLLAKQIVDKNANSISMIKILGYTGREATGIYNVTTIIATIVFVLVAIPIDYWAMKKIYYRMMLNFNGWLPFYVAPWVFAAIIGAGIGCCLLVQFIQLRRVDRIPESLVLKNVE